MRPRITSLFAYLGLGLSQVAFSQASALEAKDIVGTWRLVSSTRRVLATGQVNDTYGAHPVGWITYGPDGRMIVLIVDDPQLRPKPASVASMTDAERVGLFKTMLAYSGTYAVAGNSVTHNIDASWNEVWTGTNTVRDVEIKGGRLIYTTKPAPASMDGQMSVVTLVWERAR